ncbi:MAG: EutN/CcmL family microcompartment protein [bacterium]|nr:EutN/CcmL family microcompartment protein [Candidatus Sumerlaeota bacterium]
MFLAKVVGKVISTEKYEVYASKKLLVVQKLSLDRKPSGLPTIAIDYVGAGEGNLVLVGAAPGLASVVFNFPKAPIRELIMGIVDTVEISQKSNS